MTERAPTFRPGITCPKTGAPIPLDTMSVSKWSDELYLVRCPACHLMHEFTPVAALGEERPR